MPIHSDKPHLWKEDIAQSVDLFNSWFLQFAPKAYRDTRLKTTEYVEDGLQKTRDLTSLTPAVLKANPSILPTLRMCTCPPIARDRLSGLSRTTKGFIGRLEEGKLPPRMPAPVLDGCLEAITQTIARMLDVDIFPWLAARQSPTEEQRYRAATIVADRLCGAVSDPIIRNAQERRQLELIGAYLGQRGYRKETHAAGQPLTGMTPGTYAFRMIVVAGRQRVNIPVDIVVQPLRPRADRLPILIEAKSAGDYTNVNKRRKEEAAKMAQLKETYGPTVPYVLFLCGYFDSGYLGYEAAEGIDWIWEHRMRDLDQLGL